jgi:hypothetical protein
VPSLASTRSRCSPVAAVVAVVGNTLRSRYRRCRCATLKNRCSNRDGWTTSRSVSARSRWVERLLRVADRSVRARRHWVNGEGGRGTRCQLWSSTADLDASDPAFLRARSPPSEFAHPIRHAARSLSIYTPRGVHDHAVSSRWRAGVELSVDLALARPGRTAATAQHSRTHRKATCL